MEICYVSLVYQRVLKTELFVSSRYQYGIIMGFNVDHPIKLMKSKKQNIITLLHNSSGPGTTSIPRVLAVNSLLILVT